MARRMFRVGGLVSREVVRVISVAAVGFCVVSAAPAAMEGSAGASGEDVGCSRPLVDVIWGFLVTLLALSISLWGSTKHLNQDTTEMLLAVGAALFAPLQDLYIIVEGSCWCGAMLWSCHRVQDPSLQFISFSWFKKLGSSLLPRSKSLARILATCDIVVHVPIKSELLQEDCQWLWDDNNGVVDESEAMVIGADGARDTQNVHNYSKNHLSCDGTAALLWGEILSGRDDLKFLPKYDELKFLRGDSGFAVLATVVQAIGYIYAVMFRSAKDLRVEPLEIDGLIFNILLLIKASLFSMCNPCHRPLVIYMNEERETKFLNILKFKNKEDFNVYNVQKMKVSIFNAIVVCLIIPLIYFIVITMKVTNIMVVLPLFILLVGIFLQVLATFFYMVNRDTLVICVMVLVVLLNAIAYTWAIVVTVVYWKSQYFNTRAELVNLFQVIPFIG